MEENQDDFPDFPVLPEKYKESFAEHIEFNLLPPFNRVDIQGNPVENTDYFNFLSKQVVSGPVEWNDTPIIIIDENTIPTGFDVIITYMNKICRERYFKKIKSGGIVYALDFLETHFRNYYECYPEHIDRFLLFVSESLHQEPDIPEGRKENIREWIDLKRTELNAQAKEPEKPITKTNISHPQQILLFDNLGIIQHLKNSYPHLGDVKIAKVISYLSNRGFDNTEDYLRYLSIPEANIPRSKKNLNPNTRENINYINRLLRELNIIE